MSREILEQLQRQLAEKFQIQCIDGDPLSIFCEASAILVAKLQQERTAKEKKWWVEFWQTVLSIKPEPARSSVGVLSIPDVLFACFVGQAAMLHDGDQMLHFLTACAGNNPQITPTAMASGPQQWPLVRNNRGGFSATLPDNLTEELKIKTNLRAGMAVPGTMSLFLQAPDWLLQALAGGVWSWRPARGMWVNDETSAVTFKHFPDSLFLAVPYSSELRCGFPNGLPTNRPVDEVVSIYANVAQVELHGKGIDLARRTTLEFGIGGQNFTANVLGVCPGRNAETDDEFTTRCGRLFRSYSISETSTVFSLMTPREIRAGILSRFAGVRWVGCYAQNDQTQNCILIAVEPPYAENVEKLTKEFPGRIVSESAQLVPKVYHFLEQRLPTGWMLLVSAVPIRMARLIGANVGAAAIRNYCCDLTSPILVTDGQDPKQALLSRMHEANVNLLPNTINIAPDLLSANGYKCDAKIELVWPVLE